MEDLENQAGIKRRGHTGSDSGDLRMQTIFGLEGKLAQSLASSTPLASVDINRS